MSQRIRYFVVNDETFHARYIHGMHGRFNEAVFSGRRVPGYSFLMMARGPGSVVGYASLFYSELYNQRSTYLSYLEIAQDCRKQGLGPRLFSQVFLQAAKHGDTLVLSPYTELGKRNLLPHQACLERRYHKRLSVAHEQSC